MQKLILLLLGSSLVSGFTQDSDCFENEFGSSSSGSGPDQIQVKIRHMHYKREGFGDTITTEMSYRTEMLNLNEKTVFNYYVSSGSGFTDYTPRNLTLRFDGTDVQGAIGHLKDSYNGQTGPVYSQQWLSCNAENIESSTFKFHEYSAVYSDGDRSSLWDELEIEVSPPSTPLGPSYDNECASFAGIPSTKSSSTLNVHVKHIRVTQVSTGTFPSTQSEHDLTVNGPVVLQLNTTTASDKYGFKGDINPRNLTLWVNDRDELVVAMASLSQVHAFINDHQENTETWECPWLDEDNELVFCSFTSYSTSGTYSKSSDIVEVTVTGSTGTGNGNGSGTGNGNGSGTGNGNGSTRIGAHWIAPIVGAMKLGGL